MNELTNEYGIVLKPEFSQGTRDDVWQRLLGMDISNGVATGGLAGGGGSKGVVVQVEEYVDVSISERDAARRVAAGGRAWGGRRALKLWVTDGVTKAQAVEITPLKILDNITPGSKLGLREFEVRHGIIILNEKTVFFGGFLPSLTNLEAAYWKHAMLNVVGKPYLKNLSVAASSPPPPAATVTQRLATSSPPSSKQRAMANQPSINSFVERRPAFQQQQQNQQPTKKNISDVTPGFQYLAAAQDCRQGKSNMVVRAYLDRISGVMQYHNNRYELFVILDDGTAKVHCQVADAVVAQMVGVPAKTLKEYETSGNPLFQSLTISLQEQLEVLGAKYMQLSFPPSPSPPSVTSFSATPTLPPTQLAAATSTLVEHLKVSTDPAARQLAEMATNR